jgi:hypothetical protein
MLRCPSGPSKKKREKRLDQFVTSSGYEWPIWLSITHPLFNSTSVLLAPPPPRKRTLASPAMLAKRWFAAGLIFFTVCPVLRAGRQRILLLRRPYCNGYAMLRKTHEQPGPLARRILAPRVLVED